MPDRDTAVAGAREITAAGGGHGEGRRPAAAAAANAAEPGESKGLLTCTPTPSHPLHIRLPYPDLARTRGPVPIPDTADTYPCVPSRPLRRSRPDPRVGPSPNLHFALLRVPTFRHLEPLCAPTLIPVAQTHGPAPPAGNQNNSASLPYPDVARPMGRSPPHLQALEHGAAHAHVWQRAVRVGL